MVVNESSNTICTICYAHLKPPDEAIQAISICGHVFHDLWLSKTMVRLLYQKDKNSNMSSRENITRLYFQKTVMTGINEEEWRLLCIKVNKSQQESEDTEQLRKWKEEARKEMCLKNKDLVQAESHTILPQVNLPSTVKAVIYSSQPQALGVTGGTSQNMTARNCDGIAYLMAVMNKFQYNREKYDEFIQVLKDYKAKNILFPVDAELMDIRDVKSRVIHLLKGHADNLILGFRPNGITLELVMDDLPRRSMQSVINSVTKVKVKTLASLLSYIFLLFCANRQIVKTMCSDRSEVQQKVVSRCLFFFWLFLCFAFFESTLFVSTLETQTIKLLRFADY
ncbi:hypothetical protein MKW92_047294 [Papaver armeniacum]|nr:hypothetical protein MKW92_047294 [Papaver armeniacum]